MWFTLMYKKIDYDLALVFIDIYSKKFDFKRAYTSPRRSANIGLLAIFGDYGI